MFNRVRERWKCAKTCNKAVENQVKPSMSQQSNSAKSLKTQKKISIPVQRDQIHENLSGKTRQVQQTRQDRMNEKKTVEPTERTEDKWSAPGLVNGPLATTDDVDWVRRWWRPFFRRPLFFFGCSTLIHSLSVFLSARNGSDLGLPSVLTGRHTSCEPTDWKPSNSRQDPKQPRIKRRPLTAGHSSPYAICLLRLVRYWLPSIQFFPPSNASSSSTHTPRRRFGIWRIRFSLSPCPWPNLHLESDKPSFGIFFSLFSTPFHRFLNGSPSFYWLFCGAIGFYRHRTRCTGVWRLNATMTKLNWIDPWR